MVRSDHALTDVCSLILAECLRDGLEDAELLKMMQAHDLPMDDLLQAVVRSPAEKTADPKVVDATRREAARRLIGARALMKGDDERAALALGVLLLGGARAVPMAPRRDMMPRRSDVILKSVEIHPGWRSGCDNECNSTLSTAAAFSGLLLSRPILDCFR